MNKTKAYLTGVAMSAVSIAALGPLWAKNISWFGLLVLAILLWVSAIQPDSSIQRAALRRTPKTPGLWLFTVVVPVGVAAAAGWFIVAGIYVSGWTVAKARIEYARRQDEFSA